MNTNKKKIINDPVFGFLTIRSELIFDLIEHPYFQRLRRIRQLGLSSLVYPGANHTRFEHALGAVHLMQEAVLALQMKGVEISDREAEAVICAILLHDIGHGPFSHALEHSIVNGVSHEHLSLLLMESLNKDFDGALELTIAVFKNCYPRKFLHQLVAGQLDIDRLDYLRRDSFFTGVSEGVIGSDRIIKMMDVRNDELVIEVKGIYSVEKFLQARRMMYWQVYLHKTVLSAEHLMMNVLRRAKELSMHGDALFATPPFSIFLKNEITLDCFRNGYVFLGRSLLDNFAQLDDADVLASIKVWQFHPDMILSYLSSSIINRRLFRVKVRDKPFSSGKIDRLQQQIVEHFDVGTDEVAYFFVSESITNSVYVEGNDKINVLYKNGKIKEIDRASDMNLLKTSQPVRKYFVCYPKELDIK